MYLLNVIPIQKGARGQMLTYFSAKNADIGDIAMVPIRLTTVPSIVINSQPIESAKQELRKSSFTIKKASLVKNSPYSPAFLKSAKKISEHFVAPIGGVLFSLTPNSILRSTNKAPEKTSPNEIKGEIFAIQEPDQERLSHYKSIVREEFARKKSVFVLAPSKNRATRLASSLGKGIEEYQFVLHSGLSEKEQVRLWKKAVEEKHSVLVIATGSFVSLPRNDIGTYIIEGENNDGYKIPHRPFIDLRIALQYIAKEQGARLIFGDTLLRTEIIAKHKNGEILDTQPLVFRYPSRANFSVINMVGEDKKFSIFSPELLEIISSLKEQNEKIFLYASRKGTSPQIVCNDCGHAVTNSDGTATMVFYKDANRGNYFLCPRTGEKRNAAEACKHCSSWNLVPLGIGADRISEEIKKNFPEIPLFVVTKDNTRTENKIREKIENFYASPNGILIGTDVALEYLNEPITYTGSASIDSLFSLPDIGINEKIMRIIITLRGLAEKRSLIQTRNREQSLFDFAESGNILEFFRKEIEDREALHLPPTSILIKITTSNKNRDELRTNLENLAGKIQNAETFVYSAFIPKLRGMYFAHLLIKLPRKEWPRKDVSTLLHSLSPNWIISVEPESIL